MHSDEMSSAVDFFFKEASALQWKKNADYHPDKVAFLEILRTASECNISVEQDLWAKIRKQYVALRSYVIDGNTESESPRSRMMDIAVYMGMFAFWTDNKDEIIHGALNFMRDTVPCDVYHGFGRTDDTEATTTCFRMGIAPDTMCDRCRFVYWLLKWNERAH